MVVAVLISEFRVLRIKVNLPSTFCSDIKKKILHCSWSFSSRLEGEFCDIAIVVEDVKFRAHSKELPYQMVTTDVFPPWPALPMRLFGKSGALWRSLHGDKCGNEQEEAKLQNVSKQIVHTVIQQAVQQLSQESQQKEKARHGSGSLQLERGQLTKKHEKK
ncbi:Hypothetical predicted protein [Podarcis lilfordi]|uniref:A-kinase anchor protein 7 RI-RII subunit-binding domain-containing protein n=1 Tax=Podarcis lilfordi TaxID=74358 RepID=A0AA35KLN4_9SAUR|nr:Hypothetical predicted protein [Podarcis lilfordi]